MSNKIIREQKKLYKKKNIFFEEKKSNEEDTFKNCILQFCKFFLSLLFGTMNIGLDEVVRG